MFRFTIRDVLWLTVVVALLLGWFRDHRALTKWTQLHLVREEQFYKENQRLRTENSRLSRKPASSAELLR